MVVVVVLLLRCNALLFTCASAAGAFRRGEAGELAVEGGGGGYRDRRWVLPWKALGAAVKGVAGGAVDRRCSRGVDKPDCSCVLAG